MVRVLHMGRTEHGEVSLKFLCVCAGHRGIFVGWHNAHRLAYSSFVRYNGLRGTDPKQKVAIATGLIVPALRTAALEREWNTFKDNEQFKSFHTSPCLAGNEKEGFGDWDEPKKLRVLRRVRTIAKKYGVKAFSLAINKIDYEEIMPQEFRELAGRFHYTWAIRNLISLLDGWAISRGVETSYEYLYHWMDPRAQKQPRQEIETVMAQAEEGVKQKGIKRTYVNYSFRNDEELPALQCVDAVGWACYQYSLKVFAKTPLSEIAAESFHDFYRFTSHQDEWLIAVSIERDKLKDWVEREKADGKGLERLREWAQTRQKPNATWGLQNQKETR
ncbi:MAG: hypothetical protein WB729_11215 [Candidatus Sulfotelmatobacter sp.]